MKIGLEKGAARSRQQRETNRVRVLGAVQAAGAAGVTTTQLRNTLCLGESSVGSHLRALYAQRVVSKHPEIGHTCRWYFGTPTPQSPRKYIRKRVTPDQWVTAWAESPIVRRIIPAADAPPLQHVGVRSVWELA